MRTILELGQAIRQLRSDQHLTGVALAQRCGINRNTLNEFERGLGNIQLNTLLSLCHQLGVEINLTPILLKGMVEQPATHSSPLSKLLAARANQNKKDST